MNQFNSARSKAWNIHTGPDPSPSQTGVDHLEAPWKNRGASMDAISFGLLATAILITMFLIMAIFEHLFRPNPSFFSPQRGAGDSLETRLVGKIRNPQVVSTSHTSDLSVLMPGQHYPTFIAQPAPLPCPREGVCWPSHEHT